MYNNMSELSDQDLEAIEEIHNYWIREELAGNGSRVIELCTDDVRWMPPNAPPLVGKPAIAQYLSDSTVGLKDVQAGDVVICGSGSVAYLTSSYHSRFVVEGGWELQEAAGTHLWILRKTGGGAWRVAVVAWSLWGPGNC
ncbi:MAG: DUF4440 domain-containing protein [Pyrinomonadaceae bacterium]|nr:DUF4440 domain-containing protein [Pyrinomonadaceae bacterium]